MSRQIWEWEGASHQGGPASMEIEGNGPEHYWVTIHERDEMAMVFVHRSVLEGMLGAVSRDIEMYRELDAVIEGETAPRSLP